MSAKEVYACVYIKILNEFQLLVLCNSVTRRLAASAEAQGGLEKIQICRIQIFTRAEHSRYPPGHAEHFGPRRPPDLTTMITKRMEQSQFLLKTRDIQGELLKQVQT